MKVCIKCDIILNEENWSLCNQKIGWYVCRNCANEYKRKYRAAHLEKVRATRTLWRKRNRERINEHRRRIYKPTSEYRGVVACPVCGQHGYLYAHYYIKVESNTILVKKLAVRHDPIHHSNKYREHPSHWCYVGRDKVTN